MKIFFLKVKTASYYLLNLINNLSKPFFLLISLAFGIAIIKFNTVNCMRESDTEFENFKIEIANPIFMNTIPLFHYVGDLNLIYKYNWEFIPMYNYTHTQILNPMYFSISYPIYPYPFNFVIIYIQTPISIMFTHHPTELN